MSYWSVVGNLDEERELFADIKKTAQLTGEVINCNWMSRVTKVEGAAHAYYVKVYSVRGRWLRRYIGRSRLRAEWENLAYFKSLGLPTADLVAYGESTVDGYLGIVVTREIRATADLSDLARNEPEQFTNRNWRLTVIRRIADASRALHQDSFAHNDLKWRNILVERKDDPQIYLIDCPVGMKKFGPFLSRGIIKDLACLDKESRGVLSNTDRLRFYLRYRGADRLNDLEKRNLRKVLAFFEGR